jgi:hypothetical protein
MAKQKNTENKKLHSKLMAQKKNKKQSQKEANKVKIRLLNQLANKKEELNLPPLRED